MRASSGSSSSKWVNRPFERARAMLFLLVNKIITPIKQKKIKFNPFKKKYIF